MPSQSILFITVRVIPLILCSSLRSWAIAAERNHIPKQLAWRFDVVWSVGDAVLCLCACVSPTLGPSLECPWEGHWLAQAEWNSRASRLPSQSLEGFSAFVFWRRNESLLTRSIYETSANILPRTGIGGRINGAAVPDRTKKSLWVLMSQNDNFYGGWMIWLLFSIKIIKSICFMCKWGNWFWCLFWFQD